MKPDRFLAWTAFVFTAAALLGGPWLFGAWEVWWLWPFVFCLFVGTLCLSIRFLLHAFRPIPDMESRDTRPPTRGMVVLLSFAPFLVYAFVRAIQADVRMDAERSFLLFLTPIMIGIQIVFGFDRKQRDLLYGLIILNLFLLGIYGIANHLVTGSRYVLWAPGFPQYYEENRACGSYFCPDHFSGIMEIGFALGIGLLLARDVSWKWKPVAVLLSLVALAGIVLSRSRGGGLTIIVTLAAALIWGFSQWSTRKRRWYRIAALAAGLIALVIVCNSSSGYMTRFKSHFEWDRVKQKDVRSMGADIIETLRVSSRGRMFAGAVRAWKTRPVFGIGAGMHRNLWPHFAPSSDGHRELGQWPSLPNNDFHSYEVHSDWLQLLEEYGVVGAVLFLAPVFVLWGALGAGLRERIRERRQTKVRENNRSGAVAFLLGGLLSGIALAFHSLGDFNLQMPATVWMLGAVLALPLADVTREKES